MGAWKIGDVLGHLNHVHAVAGLNTGVRIGKHIQFTTARTYFHQVRLEFLE